jgi:RHS repeat-associated protein
MKNMAYSLAGYNGQRPDPVSGHYHLGNGYRAYSPVLGYFTTPDSWSPFAAGGINPYAYCAGDPINRADPSGHMSQGQGISMVLGLLGGIMLGVLTDGAALPVVLTLVANAVGDAAIGGLSELAAEEVDGQRVSGKQVGIAAGINAGLSLVGSALGQLRKLKITASRPFEGLMMEGGAVEADVRMISSKRMQINVHPEDAPPVHFYKSAGIEVRYDGGKIINTRLSGFTSNFNGKGDPGLILHRSASDKLKFTLGSAATINGVQVPQDVQAYTVEGLIDYFYERNIDLRSVARGKPLHLVACSVSGKDGAAQMLANMLERDVIAYGHKEVVYHEGLYPLGNGKVFHETSDVLLKPRIYRPML